MPDNDTSKRGFASMEEDKQGDIASKGGQSVPDEKRSFSQDRELASEAGQKGGEVSGGGNRQRGAGGSQSGGQGGQQGDAQGNQQGGQQRGGNFADDPQRASEAGRKGGQS